MPLVSGPGRFSFTDPSPPAGAGNFTPSLFVLGLLLALSLVLYSVVSMIGAAGTVFIRLPLWARSSTTPSRPCSLFWSCSSRPPRPPVRSASIGRVERSRTCWSPISPTRKSSWANWHAAPTGVRPGRRHGARARTCRPAGRHHHRGHRHPDGRHVRDRRPRLWAALAFRSDPRKFTKS